MGYGFDIKCESCNFSRRVMLGEGMMTPSIAYEERKKMQNGEYGPDIQELTSGDDVGVSAFSELYVCTGCGELSTEMTLELYQTKDGSLLDDVVISPADADGYNLLMAIPHTCKKCGKALKVAEKLSEVSCPRCHGALKRDGRIIMWD